VGGAQSALDEAVRYALARHQFGKPIAAFQAVKHMCADALLAIQEAKAVLAYATWALDDGSPEAERALLAAKISATDAYVASAARAVQVFGAMGTTREVSVQVHFRRARFLSLILGSNDTDRETLADQLGLSA
jgi:alkylation response protein AidB-like acyl-CoA dehydrogenase